jgi:lactate 2-monooxygenase
MRRGYRKGASEVRDANARQANGGFLPSKRYLQSSRWLLFDSGVRGGSDMATALALGATTVGVGRPYIWALAVSGADGVVSQLRALLAELDFLMAVDGFST